MIPNGRLMIPDRLQYFLEHFWIDQKCDQIWTLGPRICYQNISKKYKKIWGQPWHILNFHTWESFFEIDWKSAYLVSFVSFFVFLKPWVPHFYQNLWRWGSKDDKNGLNEITWILDMNFYQKTWIGNSVNPTNFSIFM